MKCKLEPRGLRRYSSSKYLGSYFSEDLLLVQVGKRLEGHPLACRHGIYALDLVLLLGVSLMIVMVVMMKEIVLVVTVLLLLADFILCDLWLIKIWRMRTHVCRSPPVPEENNNMI